MWEPDLELAVGVIVPAAVAAAVAAVAVMDADKTLIAKVRSSEVSLLPNVASNMIVRHSCNLGERATGDSVSKAFERRRWKRRRLELACRTRPGEG